MWVGKTKCTNTECVLWGVGGKNLAVTLQKGSVGYADHHLAISQQ